MGSRYTPSIVDPAIDNSAHSFLIGMVGMNKRVLELGAAGGDVTAALSERGCDVTAIELDPDAVEDLRQHAQRVICADLNDPATLDSAGGPFDAICAGDVLEHLLDPQRVLNQMARMLAPGGRIVVSLPNIAHVDVRLALMQGRFDYTPEGLLDATHVQFFTLPRIQEVFQKAGLLIIDMRRVRLPAFHTEVELDRHAVLPGVLEQLLLDPEAETYQFVFTAVRDDGNLQTSELALQVIELQAENDRLRAFQRDTSAELAEAQTVRHARNVASAENELLRNEIDKARVQTRSLRRRLARSQAHNVRLRRRLKQVHQSTSWKVTKPLRGMSRLLRRLVGRQ